MFFHRRAPNGQEGPARDLKVSDEGIGASVERVQRTAILQHRTIFAS